jgi:hypothetical protein
MGTARFSHQRLGVPVKLAAALVGLFWELGMAVGDGGSGMGLAQKINNLPHHMAGLVLPRVERRLPSRTLSLGIGS